MSGEAALRDVAALLAPPPGEGSATLVLAPPDWAAPDWAAPGDRPDVDVVVWGRPALPAGAGAHQGARQAVARERALVALRRHPPAARVVRGVHRMDPPALRVGLRAGLRTALLRGALVELARPGAPRRVLDAVLAAAGAGAAGRLRLGAGGTLLTPVEHPAGPGVLRAAPQGAPGDPAPVAVALRTLAGDPRVPPLHAADATAGASWTVEGRLAGRRPAALTPALVDEVAAFCAGLPRPGGPASAQPDLELLAERLPQHAGPLLALAHDLAPQLGALPAVGRHGDLWSGNLLADGGRLTAVLDWDAWSPTGVPGTDLLHLLGTERRLRTRAALGEVLLERPWDGEPARSALTSYWRLLDVAPASGATHAVGVAWWAAQLAGDLRRTPALAEDAGWRAHNVERVLAAHDAGTLLRT